MKSIFRIPMRIHHGLLIMTELAAVFKKKELVTLEKIAEKEKISQGFLEEIALALRRSNLIKGRRGPKGGYTLTQNPNKISVSEILEALEGPVELVACLSAGNNCSTEKTCTNRKVWKRIQDQITNTLDTITLSDLI
ncbi:Rrf2 family transcriptional regulator [Patescibacteria group bacterium]|nr:Rrf2 family transcriptional regulator [Patescibacteria group bacterium]